MMTVGTWKRCGYESGGSTRPDDSQYKGHFEEKEESQCEMVVITTRCACEDEAESEWDIMKGITRGSFGKEAKSR
jgi:hypothetical protein